MSVFDWLAFLQHHGIVYAEQGRNVARGHVNIACPFCGSDDPSKHMGLELATGRYACWRDPEHRGKNPIRVVRALLRCTTEQARSIVDDDSWTPVADFDVLDNALASLDAPRNAEALKKLNWPSEARHVLNRTPTRKFFRYLKRRGFDDIKLLRKQYGLRCAVFGRFKDRVLFPITQDNELVGWTGRAVGRAVKRYDAYPTGDALSHCLFNGDACRDRPGKLLVIVEGPIDALKIDYYGRLSNHRVRAAALLTTSGSGERIARIMDAAERHERVLILLDRGATKQAHRLASQLSTLRPVVGVLEGWDDPGMVPADLIIPCVLRAFDTGMRG